MSKANRAREKRLNQLLKEDKKLNAKPYKTIDKNPEVYEGTTLVENIKENPDGSATIQLKFTDEQKDMLFDVCLRNALVAGLKKIDEESATYAKWLEARSKVLDQMRITMEVITAWETDAIGDWSPMVATEVQVMRELLSKFEGEPTN